MPMELDIKRTVKKSNILNEMRNANASMAEYRLFCVYLAHLPMESDDNCVTFSLAEYARIAGLDRPRYADIKNQAENIVGTTATLPNDDGGFTVYSLFSDFKLHREDERWMVSLECNPKIAPMIREQKGRFLRYKLYNTIFLKSYNQQRIYEILKQYEKIGVRTETLEDLREFLSIGKNEYPVWYNFSRDVLKVAQKAIKESTDISFEYEPVKRGKKVVAVKFIISKNEAYKDLLKLDGFLPDSEIEYEGGDIEVSATLEMGEDPNQISIDDVLAGEPTFEYANPVCEMYAEACGFEFDQDQIEEIMGVLDLRNIGGEVFDDINLKRQIKCDFLGRAYRAMKVNSKTIEIENRYKYFLGLLKKFEE